MNSRKAQPLDFAVGAPGLVCLGERRRMVGGGSGGMKSQCENGDGMIIIIHTTDSEMLLDSFF